MHVSRISSDLIRKIKEFRNASPKRHHYPAEIKALVIKEASSNSGISFHQLGKSLGINSVLIKKWCKENSFSEIVLEEPVADRTSNNELIFRYPNGLEVRICDQCLTPDLIDMLKGA